jgi:hypothetical protein
VILIGFANARGPQTERRLSDLYRLVFSFGPAWHGNQKSILLQSDLRHGEIAKRIAPLVGENDLVTVIEVSIKSITTMGYVADVEGLDRLHPSVVKLKALPRGAT